MAARFKLTLSGTVASGKTTLIRDLELIGYRVMRQDYPAAATPTEVAYLITPPDADRHARLKAVRAAVSALQVLGKRR